MQEIAEESILGITALQLGERANTMEILKGAVWKKKSCDDYSWNQSSMTIK